MNTNYTDEQVADIKKRMEEGNAYLTSIGLQTAFTIMPFLQDTKYTNVDGSVKIVENPEVISSEVNQAE